MIMDPITMNDVQPGDKIKFAEDATHTHTVRKIQHHSWEHSLRIVATSKDNMTIPANCPIVGVEMTIPANCPIVGVEMIRPFSYLCESCGDVVKILFDIVNGAPPCGVLCSDCPAKEMCGANPTPGRAGVPCPLDEGHDGQCVQP